MYGAYPAVPDRPAYAHDTNVKELIDAQKPLVHERGDPEDQQITKNIKARELEDAAIAPFVTPEPLQDYDIIVHPVSGAQSMGDPLDRAPAAVEDDLNKGWVRAGVAERVHGVVAVSNGRWTVDEKATARKRKKLRDERKGKAVPFRQWWDEERKRVEACENMDPAVIEMWRSSMELSPGYGDELRAFWRLPEDFIFELPAADKEEI